MFSRSSGVIKRRNGQHKWTAFRKTNPCLFYDALSKPGRRVSFIVPIEFRGLQDGSLVYIAEQLLENILQSSLSLLPPSAVSPRFAPLRGHGLNVRSPLLTGANTKLADGFEALKTSDEPDIRKYYFPSKSKASAAASAKAKRGRAWETAKAGGPRKLSRWGSKFYVGLGSLDLSIFIHPSIIDRYGLNNLDEISVRYDICADTIARHPNIYDPTATMEDDCLSALVEQLTEPRLRLRKEILSHSGYGQHPTMRDLRRSLILL